MPVIFIKKGETYDTGECWQGLNLLGHAQMIELFIGSKCGGHGECGADRIWLNPEDQKKVNAPSSAEKAFLKPEELARGMRIACQCFPSTEGLKISVFLD